MRQAHRTKVLVRDADHAATQTDQEEQRSVLPCIEIAVTCSYGQVLMNHKKTQIAETIAELRRQQMDVLRAATCGDIAEDDVAAYHSLDLEIRYLADEIYREDSSR